MDFKTKQKLHNVKRKVLKALSNVWYTLVYPLAWVLDKYGDLKYNRHKKKVENMSIEKAGKLMAKYIQKQLISNPKRVWELYVCKTSYWSEGDPVTVVDYMMYCFYYGKGEYETLYDWAYGIHYNKKLNDVWLNGELAQIIYDELSKVKGLDVHWEYVCELNEKYEYFDVIKDYQKHLVIKVKQD